MIGRPEEANKDFFNLGPDGSKLYCKFPKYSDTQKNCCNHPKSWTRWRFLSVMHPKDAEGIANSVDPDQSDLGLHCLSRPVCPKTYENYGSFNWCQLLHIIILLQSQK